VSHNSCNIIDTALTSFTERLQYLLTGDMQLLWSNSLFKIIFSILMYIKKH